MSGTPKCKKRFKLSLPNEGSFLSLPPSGQNRSVNLRHSIVFIVLSTSEKQNGDHLHYLLIGDNVTFSMTKSQTSQNFICIFIIFVFVKTTKRI